MEVNARAMILTIETGSAVLILFNNSGVEATCMNVVPTHSYMRTKLHTHTCAHRRRVYTHTNANYIRNLHSKQRRRRSIDSSTIYDVRGVYIVANIRENFPTSFLFRSYRVLQKSHHRNFKIQRSISKVS